ncbi:MAG: ABC transporter permease subunit [Ruminococcaceae bacterium]|nr:ABC transporter permease subunit [Oscillospiraceae bacterium]
MIFQYKEKQKKSLFTAFEYTFVAVFWLAVWFLAAQATGEELLLPSPLTVAERMGQLVTTSEFWRITSESLLRIIYGILLGVALGVVMGFITVAIPFLYKLFRPLLTVIRATPVASFIILAIIWIGRDSLPTFISALMVVPIVWGNMYEGINTVDAQLLEVARVYDFSPVKKIKRLYLPHIVPYFSAALKTSIGLAWKAGIAAEILTHTPISIGKMLSDAKTYLETTDLFAWTLTVIILSLLLELAFIQGVPRGYSFIKRRIARRERTVSV